MLDADLSPPRVKSIVDAADGTLARAAVDDDLPVEVDKWLNVFPEDAVQLQLFIDGNWVNVGQREIVGDSPIFPLELKLPKSYLAADATLELRYKLIVDNPPDESPAITLRVDRTPRGHVFTPS